MNNKSKKYYKLCNEGTRNFEKLEKVKEKWVSKGMSKESEEFKEMMDLIHKCENLFQELNNLIENSAEEEVEKMVSDYEKIKKSLD